MGYLHGFDEPKTDAEKIAQSFFEVQQACVFTQKNLYAKVNEGAHKGLGSLSHYEYIETLLQALQYAMLKTAKELGRYNSSVKAFIVQFYLAPNEATSRVYAPIKLPEASGGIDAACAQYESKIKTTAGKMGAALKKDGTFDYLPFIVKNADNVFTCFAQIAHVFKMPAVPTQSAVDEEQKKLKADLIGKKVDPAVVACAKKHFDCVFVQPYRRGA